MKQTPIAPGAALMALPGEKFKRCKLVVHLVAPSRREDATALAVLPHVLERRCAAIPDATALARKLFALYGAEIHADSYTAGTNRVLALGISGIQPQYALAGEDLTTQYLDLLENLLFEPVVQNGAFAAEDVAIETQKQADYLKSEMNDKRSYCIRQARRKLLGDSPLGIETAGYLEDIPDLTPAVLYAAYQNLLRTAQLEVVSCGIEGQPIAERLAARLGAIQRSPISWAQPAPAAKAATFAHYSEAMDTVQGKLCILLPAGTLPDAKGEAVMRLASALYGGLPTSRLFVNVREKQSLCYYCAAGYSPYTGVLTVDSGIDHANATHASEAILHELEVLQQQDVSDEELANAKKALESVYTSAKDNPDALLNWAFAERLRGTNRTLDEAAGLFGAVTAQEVRTALAAFAPAVQYLLTNKEGA